MRECCWALPAVADEVARWRSLAQKIPVSPIREDALSALAAKRPHIDGAVLFSSIPHLRNQDLLRLLVAYEIIWDFLDSVNERSADAGVENGLQLHIALVDALDPTRPMSDYYRHSPWRGDGGYLRALVATCRESCARLPSYGRVQHIIAREAGRGRVCAVNHLPDPLARDAALKNWVTKEFPAGHEAWWFELTAAASTDLTIFALLALASEPSCSVRQIALISQAYFPWASGLAALLDSYVDRAEDAAHGDHCYVGHYTTPEQSAQRICMFIRRCLAEVGCLHDAERHALIVASMFAMYLSKSSALTPSMRDTTERIVRSGGSLTRLLHPILRAWRAVYGLRSA